MKEKKYFYEVHYGYCAADDKEIVETFHLGYFSTAKKAAAAIEAVKEKPGFKNSGGHFETTKFAVTFPFEVQDKAKVVLYEASHEYEDADGYDNWIVFGVYATKGKALAEIEKERQKSPYKEHPEGFSITDVTINLLGWTEGFVPLDDD